jgi:gliding motility-associated-like protein|tara:strand:+ start:34292 stop:35131 length:840 start_codon:yes stop_codon:yes gene_type:complete
MKLIIASFSLLLINLSAFSQITSDFTFDTLICVGDCINFTNTSTGTITNYGWNFQGGTPQNAITEDPGTICFDAAGTYDIELTVNGPAGTVATTKQLFVIDYPDSVFAYSDTTIDMGGTAYVFAEGYYQGSMSTGFYAWTSPEPYYCIGAGFCFEIYPSPLVTANYVVEYGLHPECPIRDTVTITVKYIDVIDVPNTFSPDDNGINDKVFVKGPGIIDMTFKIYDRYGKKLWETTSQSEGWDGFYKGQKLNPATFMWTLDYTLVDGTTNIKSGSITLVK